MSSIVAVLTDSAGAFMATASLAYAQREMGKGRLVDTGEVTASGLPIFAMPGGER